MLLGRREHLDPDHRLLSMRLHERGAWMVDVRRADFSFYVFIGSQRIDVALREEGEDPLAWADAAVDCILAELVELPS
jgi:hypothetical protein